MRLIVLDQQFIILLKNTSVKIKAGNVVERDKRSPVKAPKLKLCLYNAANKKNQSLSQKSRKYRNVLKLKYRLFNQKKNF